MESPLHSSYSSFTLYVTETRTTGVRCVSTLRNQAIKKEKTLLTALISLCRLSVEHTDAVRARHSDREKSFFSLVCFLFVVMYLLCDCCVLTRSRV